PAKVAGQDQDHDEDKARGHHYQKLFHALSPSLTYCVGATACYAHHSQWLETALEARASPPADGAAAVDRQRDPRDESGLVAVQEQRGVRHVPAAAHLASERDLAVARRR